MRWDSARQKFLKGKFVINIILKNAGMASKW
jgi:hypothetical protein